MHIPPYDNRNLPIIAEDHASVPRVYFNLVKLAPGEVFTYRLPAYESVVVPSVGALEVCLEGGFTAELSRRAGLWEDDPEGVYVPTGTEARLTARQACEAFIAGARYEKTLTPFHVSRNELDLVQYGSDETKTHRKIKHIIGQKQRDKVGRLLVSELFTVGAGGWSGFPPTNTTQTLRQARHTTMKPITSASGPGMALELSSCSAKRRNSAKSSTSKMGPLS